MGARHDRHELDNQGELTMCLCGIPYHDYLCSTHRQQAEHAEGRHTGDCYEFEPFAELRQRTEENDA